MPLPFSPEVSVIQDAILSLSNQVLDNFVVVEHTLQLIWKHFKSYAFEDHITSNSVIEGKLCVFLVFHTSKSSSFDKVGNNFSILKYSPDAIFFLSVTAHVASGTHHGYLVAY